MNIYEQYEQRLSEREGRVSRRENTHIWLGNIRLILAIVAVVIAVASLRMHFLSLWWLFLPIVGFLLVAVYHSHILRARDLALRAVGFYKTGIARIDGRWVGAGQTGDRFMDPQHIYAVDLDLFGRGSLFELLSTARTRIGEDTLAKWLLSPATEEQILARHAAVRELRGQLDLREDIAVLGQDANIGLHPQELLSWAERPNQMKPGWLRWLSLILCMLAIASTVVWAYFGVATPFLLIVATEAIVARKLRKPLEEALHGTEHAFHDLELLSAMLTRIEQHAFISPPLHTMKRALSSHAISSAAAIALLKTLAELSFSRDNLFLRILDIPLMYSVQLGFAAERWRHAHGYAVCSWLKVIGEMEALLCLATYSDEHPGHAFPEFSQGPAVFDAVQLGHPLLPVVGCVPNDLQVSDQKCILMISGSNMSGKSTLLRAVGINAVMAMAGAPVCAKSLKLTLLQVGASIRTTDSLQDGSSRFYAEITRLRKILDLTNSCPPVLFLFDELLQGTNSKDRRVGAEEVLRAFLGRGAIGLVSTHDLALAEIDSFPTGQLHNVHLQEEFEDGRMTFDYKLREGTITKSNGIALMRSIGLDV